MSRQRKTIARLMVAALQNMTDEQLQAVADTDPHDLSSFTDQELQAIVTDAGIPVSLARVAAVQAGLGFIGIEREAAYVAIARERIEAAQGLPVARQDGLFEVAA